MTEGWSVYLIGYTIRRAQVKILIGLNICLSLWIIVLVVDLDKHVMMLGCTTDSECENLE